MRRGSRSCENQANAYHVTEKSRSKNHLALHQWYGFMTAGYAPLIHVICSCLLELAVRGPPATTTSERRFLLSNINDLLLLRRIKHKARGELCITYTGDCSYAMADAAFAVCIDRPHFRVILAQQRHLFPAKSYHALTKLRYKAVPWTFCCCLLVSKNKISRHFRV